MLVFALICNIAPAALVGIFSHDPAVIAVGEEYLRIISWTFVASGVVFVSSSTFQAMGNTVPSLVASAIRIALVGIPALILSHRPDFELHWVWYLSLGSVFVGTTVSLLLLRREFGRRLNFESRAA